jgi:hypothetical protein
MVIGYLVAATVVAFGVFVVWRLIRSWRQTYRDRDPGST